MKPYLKQVALFGLGIAGVVAIANSTLQPDAAIAENPSIVPMEVAQTAGTQTTAPMSVSESPESPASPASIIAQVPSENALAAQLQGRPTIVKIYADWCAACQRLRPVTDSLQQQFNGRANFVIFDVTDRNTTREAEARARELGLSNFLAAHRAQTSTIAVIDPGSGQVLDQFRYNFNQQDYVNAINEAIAQTSPS